MIAIIFSQVMEDDKTGETLHYFDSRVRDQALPEGAVVHAVITENNEVTLNVPVLPEEQPILESEMDRGRWQLWGFQSKGGFPDPVKGVDPKGRSYTALNPCWTTGYGPWEYWPVQPKKEQDRFVVTRPRCLR